MRSCLHHRWRRRSRGFTIVEVVMATVIIAVMFAAVMNTVGASRTTLSRVAGRDRAAMLAAQLMSEILAKPYWDPAAQSGMGPESDETGTGDRTPFDDSDDYDGWSASPPERRDGVTIDGFARWSRSVEVDWVNPNDPTSENSSETGLKRITVIIKRGDLELARRTALRSRAWSDHEDAP